MGGTGSGRHKKESVVYKFQRKRAGYTQVEKIDLIRQDLETLRDNPFFKGIQDQWEAEKSGIGLDLNQYFEWAKEAEELVHQSPDILDNFQINIDTGTDPIQTKGPYSGVLNIIYFRANPWLVAERVFGIDNLNKACALSSKFKAFTPFQKRFLRACLDPRRHNILFIACRSAGKTWLTALAVLIMSYLMPSIKVMIISGSQEQSDNLYRYFRDLAEGTAYQRMVKEAMYKTKTDTLDGGWVRAFPASHKKVHGPRPDVVVGDEVCKAESDIILAAYSAAMSAQDPKFITMSTPDAMVHIFHEWYIEAHEQDMMTPVELAQIPRLQRWDLYHLSAYECPWITSEAIEALTYKYGGKNTHEYKIYVLGEFAPAEGLVFNEEWVMASIIDSVPTMVKYDIEDESGNVVTVEEEIALGKHETGLDVGSKHPTGIVTSCEDQIGNVYIIDNSEVRGRSGDEPIIAETHRHAMKYFSHVMADAAPIQTFTNKKLQKMLMSDGLPGLKRVPFQKEKVNMISAAKGLFEAGMLFIVKGKCEKLVNQLLTYSYDENENSDMPAKGNDDHVDAFLLSVYPHKYNYMKRKYKGVMTKVYNLEEHMEEIDHNPYKQRNESILNM